MLALDDQVLHLALLYDLEVRVSLEGEATTLEQIEELLLVNKPPIDEVVLLVCLAVVRLPHSQIIRLDRYLSILVVQYDLDDIRLRILSQLGRSF